MSFLLLGNPPCHVLPISHWLFVSHSFEKCLFSEVRWYSSSSLSTYSSLANLQISPTSPFTSISLAPLGVKQENLRDTCVFVTNGIGPQSLRIHILIPFPVFFFPTVWFLQGFQSDEYIWALFYVMLVILCYFDNHLTDLFII